MITVILNCYKRPEYLKEQVEAIKKQTIKPDTVWLWVNQAVENEALGMFGGEWGFDRVFRSSVNCKFHGRFAVGLLAQTEYVAFFDDDTIPGNKWFENCLNTMETHPGILGGAGVCLLDSKQYMRHLRSGWPTKNKETEEVDLVGHAWFLKREDLCHMWSEVPASLEHGEDLQLSYMAQIKNNIKTYCPPHPENDKDLWSSLKGEEYGCDDKAWSQGKLSSLSEFFIHRTQSMQDGLSRKWEPMALRNPTVLKNMAKK